MQRTFISAVLLITALVALAAYFRARTAAAEPALLRTVDRVELSRYLGKWYEIARLPNRFQKGCVASSAEYSLRDDGEITVINSCRDSADSSVRQVKGHAWSVDPTGNTRLKVSFFWPFRGDYWIIELGKEYEYAVVGTPNRNYLWVLSRSATMNNDLYAAILQRAEQQGFDSRAVVRETTSIQRNGAP